MAKKILPFWLIPAHWGLSGKAKEIAKINYQYDGLEADLLCADLIYLTPYEADKAKLDIRLKYDDIEQKQYTLLSLDIELKHKRISDKEHAFRTLEERYKSKELSEKEYDEQRIELMEDGYDKDYETIQYAFKYHEITENEYNKELRTLDKEPWVNFDVEYNPLTNDVELTFDYNEYFLKKLKEDGHPGTDEDEIIENYIRDWGRKLENDEYKEDYDTTLTSNTEEIEINLPEGYKIYK